MLPFPYNLLAIAAILFGTAGAGGYGMHRWDAGQYAIREAKAEALTAQREHEAFVSYQAEILRANVAEATAAATAEAVKRQYAQAKGLYGKLPKSTVPGDCRLSPERLRFIQSTVSAVTAKNAPAREPLNPVPGPGPAH